jgi:hypothetical protein
MNYRLSTIKLFQEAFPGRVGEISKSKSRPMCEAVFCWKSLLLFTV